MIKFKITVNEYNLYRIKTAFETSRYSDIFRDNITVKDLPEIMKIITDFVKDESNDSVVFEIDY